MNNTDNKTQLFLGNNIELLRELPDNSVDSIVTDAPYGLGQEPDAAEVLQSWLSNGYHEIKGRGFMGKEWDAFVPQPLFWKEAYRVLKHGGHILCFFGTRTYDWGVMAMRLAGFEVRDCVQWLYGSGFPKSHNISKAIDKMQGAEREIIGKSNYTMPKADNSMGENSYGISGGKLANGTTAERVTADITAPATEEAKQWEGWGSALKPANEPIVLARKPLEKGLSIAANVLKHSTGALNIDGCRVGYQQDEHILKYEGYRNGKYESEYKEGTSYKYATQVQVNLQGRFPANVILTHHPDCECIGTKKVKAISGGTGNASMGGMGKNGIYGEYSLDKLGANAGGLGDENGEESVENWICVDDCPVKILDEQSGILKSGKMTPEHNRTTNGSPNGIYGKFDVNHPLAETYGDTGGASRFFYTAKASKDDRNEGLNKEKWFYDLELVTEFCTFTEEHLFIEEQEVQNQIEDLNEEAQQNRATSEVIALLAKISEIYTTLNEKNITAAFPSAIKFTTKAGLTQIIELKTSNFYQPLNTNDCIVDVLETNKANGLDLAENMGIKNLLKLIFTKDEMGFPLGVKIAVKKTPLSISVKDKWHKTNTHSTVKPTELMRYLCRLITPPNGIVLDPFMGSGSTGKAAILEGFRFMGMEMEEEYFKIAEARIAKAEKDYLDSISQLKLF